MPFTLPNTLTNGTTADATQVQGNDAALLAAVNAAALASGTNDGVVRRGKSIIAIEESRSNTAYGLMTTPDRVQNVVMPTDGLLSVGYTALWKGTGVMGRAAIFIGTNQLTIASNVAAAPVTQAAALGASPTDNTYYPLSGFDAGLVHLRTSAAASQATTGQALAVHTDSTGGASGGASHEVNGTVEVLASGGDNDTYGGLCLVWAAAGTYDISVQFKSTDASAVYVKNRNLWVQAVSY